MGGKGERDLPESFAISLSRSSFSVGMVLEEFAPSLPDLLDRQNYEWAGYRFLLSSLVSLARWLAWQRYWYTDRFDVFHFLMMNSLSLATSFVDF